MGFASTLFGGSSSKAQSTSGFDLLPDELKKAFTQYGGQLTNLFPGGNKQASAFMPIGQTADETRAFDMARQGLGSQQNFANNIGMLMNPYDDYVINDINRQAQGQNSLVNQAATKAGQQGSNRSFLGTSDVEQNRLNAIGQFRQGQYNNAVEQALGPLAGLQQQDMQNLLGVGQFQRDLEMQRKQAPYTALQSYGTLLGAIPQSGGSQSTSKSQSSEGLVSGLGKTAGAIAGGLALFSDRNVKENIRHVDVEKGHNIYEFNYIGDNKKYRGVMAQEVIEKNPWAVEEIGGILAVRYDMIGLQMKEVA